MSKHKKKKTYSFPFNYECLIDSFTYRPFDLILVFLSIVLFTVCKIFEFSDLIRTILLIVSFVLCGVYIFIDAFSKAKNGTPLSESVIILIVCLLSFLLKDFSLAPLIAILYQVLKIAFFYISKYAFKDHYSVLNIIPDKAKLLNENRVEILRPSRLKTGNNVIVETGDIIPVDGYVLDGISDIDYSDLYSEKISEAVSEGSKVISGGVNKGEPIIIKASSDYFDSTSQKVYSSYSNIMNRPGKLELSVHKIICYCFSIVLLLCVLFCIVIPVFKGNWGNSVENACILLLITCPLGLLDSLILAKTYGIDGVYSSGAILGKKTTIDDIAAIETFVCNKTSTVTDSEYTVSDIVTQGIDEKSFLTIALQVESESNHPIAVAIRNYCGITEPQHFDNIVAEEISGRGIDAIVGKNRILFGNANLLYEEGIGSIIPNHPGTAIHLAINTTYCGYILFENRLRKGSVDCIEKLKSKYISNFAMLSNDLLSVVRPIASSLGFNVVKAELKEGEKIAAVEYLKKNKNNKTNLLFVGNGMDEETTCEYADISAATGIVKCGGSLDKFDISILSDSITPLSEIISISSKCIKASKINIYVSAGIRVFLLILLLLKAKNIILDVVLMILSSLFTFVNSAFLLKKY